MRVQSRRVDCVRPSPLTNYYNKDNLRPHIILYIHSNAIRRRRTRRGNPRRFTGGEYNTLCSTLDLNIYYTLNSSSRARVYGYNYVFWPQTIVLPVIVRYEECIHLLLCIESAMYYAVFHARLTTTTSTTPNDARPPAPYRSRTYCLTIFIIIITCYSLFATHNPPPPLPS